MIFLFCLFRQEIYSTGLHRSKCTGSDMCKRAHASTRTHINKHDGTQLQVNIHQKTVQKMFSHPKTEKKNKKTSKMKRWKMNTPTKERPC